MSKYSLESRSFSPLSNVHGGTGLIKGAAHAVVPASVERPPSEPMEFKYQSFSIVVLSLEIDTLDAPNWFGVGFRQGIKNFDTVNIFCHPSPGGAGMQDSEYRTRSGAWPRLFRYVEMFARQMDMAKKDIVCVVPFFTNATYGSTGLFGANWRDLIEQILVLARAHASGAVDPAADRRRVYVPEINPLVLRSATIKRRAGGGKAAPPPPAPPGRLRNVVLSDFSYGRTLMWTVRRSAPGLGHFLREVWDFDGVSGPVPVNASGVRGSCYDQDNVATRHGPAYHVPPARWEPYHKIKTMPVHGNIPEMLAWHAATISTCG